MKFKIEVCDEEDGNHRHYEEYILNINDPEQWAKEAIEEFNNTLREYEKRRKYLGYEIIDKDLNVHIWHKTNAITIIKKDMNYDTMQCSVCGITGKRYGLGRYVQRDSKYLADKYEYCKPKILKKTSKAKAKL